MVEEKYNDKLEQSFQSLKNLEQKMEDKLTSNLNNTDINIWCFKSNV